MNTCHSEPDVANRPQISARQRPGCGERLPRSGLVCVARCVSSHVCLGEVRRTVPSEDPPAPKEYRLYAPRQQTP